MLKGISPLLSPKLLATLCRMGHGDTIVLADAHFPGHSMKANTLRADGVMIPDLLDAILPLLEIDSYIPHPVCMMAPAGDDELDPAVEQSYLDCFSRTQPLQAKICRVKRQDFYDMADKAFAVVMTGDTAQYGNILLTKGVTPTT